MDSLFKVHRLNDRGMDKAKYLAEAFDVLLNGVIAVASHEPNKEGVLLAHSTNSYSGREIALVKTHLELASFYAKKAMAQLPENQE